MARSLNIATDRVVKKGLADGIYTDVIALSEIKVLAYANEIFPDNIIHICGYQGNLNILSVYWDYPVSVVNWAVFAEGEGVILGVDCTVPSDIEIERLKWVRDKVNQLAK